MNISKSGIGFSAGVTGFRVGTGPSGTYLNAGIPGTGISYRKFFKLGKSDKKQAQSGASAASAQANNTPPERPKPGFFSPGHEKALAKGLEAYEAGNIDRAKEYFREAADDEPGAAILAASLMIDDDIQQYEATQMLERVIQSDEEFPTELMQKYLSDLEIDIAVTENVTAYVPVDGLAATLLLVELYQAQRRVREAIALLEEIEEITREPVLTLSLVELYATRNLWDNIIEHGHQFESEDNITLEIMIYHGRALYEKGLYTAARTTLTQAVRRTKDRKDALINEARYWRALAYKGEGNATRATEELEKLFAANPTFRDVAARLDQAALG